MRISAVTLALLLISPGLWAASVADYRAIPDDDTAAAFVVAFEAGIQIRPVKAGIEVKL